MYVGGCEEGGWGWTPWLTSRPLCVQANFDTESEIPKLETVTADNLKYDIMDMKNAIKNRGTFGCAYMPLKVQQ